MVSTCFFNLKFGLLCLEDWSGNEYSYLGKMDYIISLLCLEDWSGNEHVSEGSSFSFSKSIGRESITG